MSTIQTIIAAFKKLPTDGSAITLDPSTFDLPFVNEVFSFLLQTDSLKFTSTTVTITQDPSATLQGTVDIFDYKGIKISLKFSVADNLVVAELSCDLGKTTTIHVPVATWLEFESVTFEGKIQETKGLADFKFASSLKLDANSSVPITLEYQAGGLWAMSVASGADKTLTGAQLATLLGGSTLVELLPSSLEKTLDNLKLDGLKANFNAKTKVLTYLNTGLTVTQDWPIAPGVILESGLGLSFSMTQKTDGGSTSCAQPTPTVKTHIDSQIQGTLKLGGVAVPLRIKATIDETSIWEFGLQPDASCTLPTLADLLSLGGDEAFVQSLPAQISTLPSIEIDALNVTFDATNNILQEVCFEVQTTNAWQVLPGYFELTEVKLDFDITNVNDTKKRKVVGDAYAAFAIGTCGFFCEIKNTVDDQNWVITGGLLPDQDLNLTTVASDMFGGALAVPTDAPQIVFTDANLKVTPQAKTFSLSAGSTTPWVLIKDKLSIESLSLSLDRKPKPKSDKDEDEDNACVAPESVQADPPAPEFFYQGNFTGVLEIGGVTVTLGAALNAKPDSGIDFKGSTDDQSIPFGTWLGDFAALFGQVDLPDWITGITLSELSVSYNTKTKDYSFGATLTDTEAPGLKIVVTIGLTHKSDGTWKQNITATLTYVEDDVDLKFALTFTSSGGNTGPKTKITRAVWSGDNPPGLSKFLLALGKVLDVGSDYPQALNWDATLTKMIVDVKEVTDKPTLIHGAGQFDLDVDGNKDWSLYFSISNDTTFSSKTDGDDDKVAEEEDAPKKKLPYVFGVALGGPMNLSSLPLVGSIPGIDDYNIDKLGFYYTNAEFPDTKSKLTVSLPDLSKLEEKDPAYTKAELSGPKFNLLALFAKDSKKSSAAKDTMLLAAQSGDTASDGSMSLVAPTDANAQSGTQSFASKQTTTTDPISWLKLNKTIGPVSLEKVGLSYSSPPAGEDGELGIFGVYFDGGFSIAGFELYLQALGITFPLPKPGGTISDPISQIHFHLNGLFLSFERPDLKISGGFLNLPGEKVDMIGQLSIQAGPYGLEAYGGFAGEISDPSLFIFMHLEAPIGGPPSFFIDGVSGGVGLNRDFILPGFSELGSYPLLPSGSTIPTMNDMAGDSAADKLEKMQTALQKLAKYMPVREGQYWFAAGLDVTTYEMIKTSAILSVSFGDYLQFAVIGSSGMSLPIDAGGDPLAYLQINFLASYSTANNRLTIMGEITPSSFILTKDIRLGGGFAFYVWLSGPQAGDFVLTIGGYSQFYDKPPQYPDVPRLSLNAKIDILTIQGEGYFALVPSALMAGIDIKATASLGPISAWFHASADFFIGWKPFSYQAHVGIVIGARFSLDIGFVTISVTIHVGVGLDVWGPEFGGRAVVDLSIISFTIDFGSAKKDAPTLNWSEFVNFLPSKTEDTSAPVVKRAAPIKAFALMEAVALPDIQDEASETKKTLVSIDVKVGRIPAEQEAAKASGVDWVVDPNTFAIMAKSAAPSNNLSFNTAALSKDTTKYLRPGNLRGQIEKNPALTKEHPLIIDPAPTGSQSEWFDVKVGIPPQDLTDLTSTLVTTLTGPKGAVNGIMIKLVKSGVSSALWGQTKPDDGSDDGLITGAVVGFEILPPLYFPSSTSYIQYYYLVFSTNNVFIEQDVAPTLVSTPFAKPQTILEDMANGTAFSSTQTTRSAAKDALSALGFDHLKLTNSDKLSTQDYVQPAELIHMTSS